VATPSSPRVYTPVPPAKILNSCYSSEKKKIQDRISKTQEEAQRKLEVVHDAYVALTKDLPGDPLEDARSGDSDQVWVLEKRENIENAVLGLIKDAKSELLRITKPPQPGTNGAIDPFYLVGLENRRFVYDALERNVRMRWLSLEREIPTFVGLGVSEPPRRRYLAREDEIAEKFFIADGRTVLLNLHDPLSPAYGSIALVMRSKAASSIFTDHFEKMWEKAKPLSDILPKVKKLVEEACTEMKEAGLGRTDILLFKTLARIGACTQDDITREMAKRKVNASETLAAWDRLSMLGVVHLERTFNLLLVEHPATVRTLIRQTKSGSKHAGLTTPRNISGKNR
jgi:sugar-specific transcriptional regulator TrmB